MSPADRRVVSRARVIRASAADIFELLSTPERHPEFDGSGTVRGLISGPARLERGSSFGMRMVLFGVPMPYRITNRVVEFEPDRLIAWRHFGGHRWRYELDPLADGTRVRESFDYSMYPEPAARAIEAAGYPARNAQSMEQSLERLARLVEPAA